jgi:hypothetical protein
MSVMTPETSTPRRKTKSPDNIKPFLSGVDAFVYRRSFGTAPGDIGDDGPIA